MAEASLFSLFIFVAVYNRHISKQLSIEAENTGG
jgi:hypothetical protein